MRFFTPAWHGEMSDAESDAVIAAYRDHVAAILPRLPATVRALAREIDVHDAKVRRVILDRAARTLRLELRAGDRKMGYFDLDLDYLGIVLDAADVKVIAAAARDERAELIYDEVDIADDGLIVHRILWWPYREFEVTFRSLAIRMAPRPDRSLPTFNDRFVDAQG